VASPVGWGGHYKPLINKAMKKKQGDVFAGLAVIGAAAGGRKTRTGPMPMLPFQQFQRKLAQKAGARGLGRMLKSSLKKKR